MDISRQCYLLFPHIGEVNQVHSYKGHSDKSLFLLKAPSVESTLPSLSVPHQENATEAFSSVVTDIYLFLFSILVSVDPEKCSLV